MKTTLKTSLVLAASLLAMGAWAQTSPVGTWQTVNDKDGKPQAHIEITERDGALFGRVVKSLNPDSKPGELCVKCTDDRKNQAMMGLEIIRGVSAQAKDGSYAGGKILDPKEGKEYRASMSLKDGGKTLAVRGYLGPFFRTQTWHRVPTAETK